MSSECDGPDFYPDWRIAESAYWEQNFPARKIVRVQHEYVPLSGGRQIGTYDLEKLNEISEDGGGFEDKESCMDHKTSKALIKNIAAALGGKQDYVMVAVTDIEYILGTGRNWKGPIRDFTLRLVKESPNQIVSVCFPGKAIRESPLVIEFRLRDYLPQDRLVVNYYSIVR